MSAPSRRFDDIPPRYENKYLITMQQADVVRRMLEPFCVMDSFSKASPSKRYLITSLYLDTPYLGCWNAWRLAAPHRFKLRIRRYGDKLGDSPVFLETKEKVGDVTVKPRVFIPPHEWLARARGIGTTQAERNFCVRRDRYQLEPKLLVRYEREAWKGITEVYARITFDARLQFQKCEEWTLFGEERGYITADNPVDVAEEGSPRILLEVKFERDIPRWMVHILRTLELTRRGFSKYGVGMKRVFDRAELMDSARRVSTVGFD